MEPITSFKGQYQFLSNFKPAEITYDNMQWRSVEHAYQAAKTDLLNEKLHIQSLECPVWAKRAGKKVHVKQRWNSIKLAVMTELVWIKFDTHKNLQEKLIATAPRELIEGNWWGDDYWGVCTELGQNNLGKILMKKRAQLISESEFYE